MCPWRMIELSKQTRIEGMNGLEEPVASKTSTKPLAVSYGISSSLANPTLARLYRIYALVL